MVNCDSTIIVDSNRQRPPAVVVVAAVSAPLARMQTLAQTENIHSHSHPKRVCVYACLRQHQCWEQPEPMPEASAYRTAHMRM